MTDNNHPITPPRELVRQWATTNGTAYKDLSALCQSVATQAARWGSDQELEACCKVLENDLHCFVANDLRAFRRPKPPSLKEQALEALKHAEEGWRAIPEDCALIRRALESLPS